MSKSTHISVFARFYFVWVALTKFNFIFFGMIKFLHSVVRPKTLITHRAVLSLSNCNKGTYFTGINPKSPSFIFWCFVIIETLLWIMRGAKSAMLSFEIDKIQIFDDTIIDVSTVCRWALNDIIIRNADSIIIKYLVWFDRIESITRHILLIVLLFIRLLWMLILILHRIPD